MHSVGSLMLFIWTLFNVALSNCVIRLKYLGRFTYYVTR